ncbi:MAG: protein translocase subunit SecF [Treponema sp.]|jgi:preprotein translocase subunit SecF|nr:protein translocase subunit SecF [Treponema sp.]
MKIIRFSRMFLPAAVFSLILAVFGILGYVVNNGFNLGIDFQAGLIQEIRLAPRAIGITYDGPGNAVISLNATSLTVAVSGAGVQGMTYQYLVADYETVGAFAQALSQITGVTALSDVSSSTPFKYLVLDAQSTPVLGAGTYWIHYLPRDGQVVPIEEVRSALSDVGDVNVQVLGNPADRSFIVRMQDSAMEESVASGKAAAADGRFDPKNIFTALEKAFGEGEIAVTSSNFVGSRFSKNLTDQAGLLLVLTLALILVYASIRFKPQYAAGAVLAILHDGLIIVAFIVWTRMEFNTTSIAAVLTILGYSINDTIVIFDRIRETKRLFPNDSMTDLLDRSITETLSRTFITTLTTMLAVVMLYIFTSGSMKDFALCLIVGMVSGVYSTIFIASGFVLFWDRFISKGKKENVPEPHREGQEQGA